MSEKNILIVDDQEEIIEVIRELIELDFEDAIVDTFIEPSKAIDNIKSKAYTVILTDLNMPLMSGMEFIKVIRTTENPNKGTPIIIITGDNNDLNLSLDDYSKLQIVNKADNIPELLEMIGQCLGN